MTTTDDGDIGWFPKGFINPADDPDIDWIVPATDDDPVPPEERLAEEPVEVEVAIRADGEDDPNQALARELRGGEATFPGGEARGFVQPGFGGLDLRDYSRNAQQKGWGAPCSAPRATVRLSEASVTVDARLAELTGLIMRACESRGYRFRRADTGAYNCRYISGTKIWSNHAWAIAVDVNWQSNPYTSRIGATDIPEWMHHLFNRYGFAWGGDYTGGKRDYMHFEFMGTPQQAQTALALARRELGNTGTVPVPAPAPAPAPPASNWQTWVNANPGSRTIQRWSVGSDVQVVQRWHGLKADGYFGDATDRAVRETQKRNGLAVDGVVGTNTWRLFGVGTGPSRPPKLSWPLPAGHWFGNMSGPARQHGGHPRYDSEDIQKFVQNIQQWLIFRGCTPVPAALWATSTWADRRWERATDVAMTEWHRRFYGGQRFPAQCWRDDYERLTA